MLEGAISNLQYTSKLVESAVVEQFVHYLTSNGIQFSLQEKNSTETALLKVHSDILNSMDKQEVTLLIMLDLSAAFDTVDLDIFINSLKEDYNIGGTVLSWFQSYLHDRSQQVIIKGKRSKRFTLPCGVPQGSCLGPICFITYLNSLSGVIKKHLICVGGYADDHQVYISFKAGDEESEESKLGNMEKCIYDIRKWMLTKTKY